MPHSAAALAEALHLSLSAKRTLRTLADLGGHLSLSLGGLAPVSLRVPSAAMDAIPGLDGMWWLQMPCAYPEAPTCTRLMVGGLAGSICALAQVPQGVRLHLLEGELMWWQQSFGRDADNERVYRRYQKNDTWELAENEPHGFVASTDFLSYNIFSPFFTD